MQPKDRTRFSPETVFPRVVGGIAAWKLFHGFYAVGDSRSDRYICLPESKLAAAQEVLSQFDGNSSLETIGKSCRTISKPDVTALYIALRDAGLLYGSAARGEIQRFGITIFHWPLGRLSERLAPFARAAFLPLACVSGALIMIGSVFTLTHWQHVYSLAGRTAAVPPWIFYPIGALAVICSIGCHECSHAVAAMRYGLIPTDIELVAYLFVIPMILIRIPRKYTISPSRRICIWLAGPWMNLTVAVLSASIISLFEVGNRTGTLLGAIAIGNLILAAANLVPLLPTDGYFILCTLLKKPNLRRRAYYQFKQWIRYKRRPAPGIIGYGVFSIVGIMIILSRHILHLGYLARHSVIAFLSLAVLVAAVGLKLWLRRNSATNISGETIG